MFSALPKRSLMLVLPTLVLLTASSQAIQPRESVQQNPRVTPIEVVQVVELPVNLQDAVLVKTKKGHELKCVLSNNSDSEILGLDYLLLLVDFNNTIRAIVDGAEDVKLDRNASKSLVSRKLLHIEVGDGYRLILIPQRVFSTASFWEVLNARKVLERYALGDYSIKPEVTRATNFVDTPIGGKVRF
jgi:hypothetical protein